MKDHGHPTSGAPLHRPSVASCRGPDACAVGSPYGRRVTAASPSPDAVLLDLLMAVMDSPAAWASAAGDPALGMRWRDGVTERMQRTDRYVPYEELVEQAAAELRLPPGAADRLWDAWREMRPRSDASALQDLATPYAFVTNCSRELARIAAARSGLDPEFTLSAEEAGRYKPDPQVYHIACERIGEAPERTLFIAGAAYDAAGARGAGLLVTLVRRRPVLEPLDGRIPVVSSLGEALRTAT